MADADGSVEIGGFVLELALRSLRQFIEAVQRGPGQDVPDAYGEGGRPLVIPTSAGLPLQLLVDRLRLADAALEEAEPGDAVLRKIRRPEIYRDHLAQGESLPVLHRVQKVRIRPEHQHFSAQKARFERQPRLAPVHDDSGQEDEIPLLFRPLGGFLRGRDGNRVHGLKQGVGSFIRGVAGVVFPDILPKFRQQDQFVFTQRRVSEGVVPLTSAGTPFHIPGGDGYFCPAGIHAVPDPSFRVKNLLPGPVLVVIERENRRFHLHGSLFQQGLGAVAGVQAGLSFLHGEPYMEERLVLRRREKILGRKGFLLFPSFLFHKAAAFLRNPLLFLPSLLRDSLLLLPFSLCNSFPLQTGRYFLLRLPELPWAVPVFPLQKDGGFMGAGVGTGQVGIFPICAGGFRRAGTGKGIRVPVRAVRIRRVQNFYVKSAGSAGNDRSPGLTLITGKILHIALGSKFLRPFLDCQREILSPFLGGFSGLLIVCVIQCTHLKRGFRLPRF